jgi:hypothetical protein
LFITAEFSVLNTFLPDFITKNVPYTFRNFLVQKISMKVPYWSSKLREKPPELQSEHQALET